MKGHVQMGPMINSTSKTYELRPDQYLVYTDGACSGNPGPGGWGALVITPEVDFGGRQVTELGGGEISTTNNRMELTAAINALANVPSGASILFFTDSTYVIRGVTQWAYGWKRNGWKTSEGQPVTNQDLFEIILSLVVGKKIQWNYVRGHMGYAGNERCDVISVAFSKKEWVQLYQGSVKNYSHNILKLPDYEALPEMKPKGEKKVAFCYLSLVNGELKQHSDWASCEARVKGKSGAKFKKAMSESEIEDIKKSWGIS